MSRTVDIDDMKIYLHLWELNGHERYYNICSVYLRGIDVSTKLISTFKVYLGQRSMVPPVP